MNMIDEQAVTDKIVNPALDRVKNEILPAIEATGEQLSRIAAANVQQAIVKSADQAMVDLAALLTKTVSDLHGLLDRLNGISLPIKANGVIIAQVEVNVPARKVESA